MERNRGRSVDAKRPAAETTKGAWKFAAGQGKKRNQQAWSFPTGGFQGAMRIRTNVVADEASVTEDVLPERIRAALLSDVVTEDPLGSSGGGGSAQRTFASKCASHATYVESRFRQLEYLEQVTPSNIALPPARWGTRSLSDHAGASVAPRPSQATLDATRPNRTRTAVVCHLLSYFGEHCVQPQ
jgi:hypothetical protein